jgi:hypothetical protein
MGIQAALRDTLRRFSDAQRATSDAERASDVHLRSQPEEGVRAAAASVAVTARENRLRLLQGRRGPQAAARRRSSVPSASDG